ncbi:MAG: hypothetical protein CM15mP49_23510 [Actinomycetota bacterium]|nr:MAG: hypothetical protein CM15mP49_23510 [Actinomycetota bacterium]
MWNPAPAPEEIVPLELLTSLMCSSLIKLNCPPSWNRSNRFRGQGNLSSSNASMRLRVVTLGADGAVVIANNHVMHVPAPVVTPVDTTGAGDAFCAALAGGLSQGKDLIASVEEACE